MDSKIVKGSSLSEKTLKNMNQYLSSYVVNVVSKEHSDKTLMIQAESGESVTGRDIIENIYKVATYLKTLGCKKDTVVAIVSENRIDYPCIFLGVMHAGGVCTCANPLYSPREISHAFNISKPLIVFASSSTYDKVKDLQASLAFMSTVINVDSEDYQNELNSVSAETEIQFANDINSTDTAAILYSSGTTGLSKGVMLTHRSYIACMENFRVEKIAPFPEDNVVSGILPMSHAYGMFVCLLCVVLGHTYVLIKRYSESTFLGYIEKYRVQSMYLVPSIVVFLSKDKSVDNYDLSCVKYIYSGGGSLGKEQAENTKARIKSCAILQNYGMTETTASVFMTLPQSKTGSIGRLLPGMMAKIIDLKDGSPLGPNQDGELCLKGSLIMKGYCNLHASNDTIDEEGWLHTGDMAYYDNDFDFYIVDRIKELIKYKAYQVPPAELEILLLQHEAINAAAVVGVPDGVAGELPRAYVVKKSGSDISEKDVEQYVAANSAPYKKLRGGVIFVERLPKTGVGKIDRKELKKWVTEG